MTLIAKKVHGSVPERLRRFVAEHLEALEPGLSVLETSLRLGRSTVDVVAVDGKQTLVLVAVADVADVTMLISTLDAYIWCLAFPDNMRRLYPNAAIAATRPPRVVFVAAQIPAAFLELVERLSVINPECHELAPATDREDAMTASAATAAALTPAVRPTAEAVAELPLAAAVLRVPDIEAQPEPALEPVALQPAARLSAGFDAAVARQWESFLAESAVAAPAPPAGPQAPVAASTPTWPPRVPPHRLLSGAPNGQPSNGQAPPTHATSAPASNGHLADGHAANGHASNGHQAIAHHASASTETDGPITRSALANAHVASGKAGNRPAPIAHAAEAVLAQAMRAAEPAPVEHAAVNLGVRPRVEAPAAPAVPTAPAAPAAPAEPAVPTAPAAPRAAAEPKPAAPRPAHEETRTVNHPALQALRFPKSGVSRQWQEFLDQLAANQ